MEITVTNAVQTDDCSVILSFGEYLSRQPNILHATDALPSAQDGDIYVGILTDLEALSVMYRAEICNALQHARALSRSKCMQPKVAFLAGRRAERLEICRSAIETVIRMLYEKRFSFFAGRTGLFRERQGNCIVIPLGLADEAETIGDLKKGHVMPPDL